MFYFPKIPSEWPLKCLDRRVDQRKNEKKSLYLHHTLEMKHPHPMAEPWESVDGRKRPFPVWEAAFFASASWFARIVLHPRNALYGVGRASSKRKRRERENEVDASVSSLSDGMGGSLYLGIFFSRRRVALCLNGTFFAALTCFWQGNRPFGYTKSSSTSRYFQKYFCNQKIFW